MPKTKTKTSLKRRFKKTGTGKIMRMSSGMRHNLACKNRKNKRRLSKSVALAPGDQAKLKKILPY